MDKMKATNHALQIEGYGVDLHFENCKCDPGQKKVNVVQGSDSNWDTQSRRWFFDNLKGDGDIDLDFATSAVGGIKEVFLDRCHFPGDSRFMLKGFDNSGGNGIKNRFRARNNDFDDMNGGLAIDLNRITKVKIANNHVDCGANTGQLVNFGSSVEDGVVNDNDGFTASALLVNTSSAVNVTDRDNVKI